MSADWLSQVALPWVLASVMMAMGLSLTGTDFARTWRHPRRVLLGTALQLLALPLLAWALVLLLPLSPLAAAGLLLVALVPGGATSNMFSYLVQGDLALSVTLTAIAAVLAPFTLPLIMGWNLELLGLTALGFSLPYWHTVGQLLLVTLLPVLAGMLLRRALPAAWRERVLPAVKGVTGVAMITMVVALFVGHAGRLPALISLETLAVLLLCLSSMTLGHMVARRLRLPHDSVRAITVEVGVQNAGVAMMVAFALLQQPAIGLVPLLYGLLMNVPVFLWMFTCLWRDRRPVSATARRY
ncbi:bile acid:sodium symporter family protein [Halomonas campisalis]|uniref:Bile acid:sodium symporter family protein n=1 Tax=Billgrantia campisalis TaxID=74661 RepID=A0ABS9P7J7_9GAMM|nr:bile acid:sodium symporter family protein [Halomonas campisalis]MCG6657581.1 bile acid:sodium symporter family protein [Halomonas campisalis]MDR5862645.1 bile acid:sodium symporter family protein [Halomonas campisalis]